MQTVSLSEFTLRVDGESLLIAPNTRPEDWREVSMSALNAFIRKQWRERCMDPVSAVLTARPNDVREPTLRKKWRELGPVSAVKRKVKS